MFLAKGRGDRDEKLKETSNEDDYGWRMCNEDDPKSPRSSRSKDCLSLDSASESMLSCIDSDLDDEETYSLAQEFKPDSNDDCEKIELASMIHKDLDVELIERDAIATEEPDLRGFSVQEAEKYFEESAGPKSQRSRSQGVCYTPERLVKSQEYRILTPSARYLSISQSRLMPENESPWKALRSRRRLNYLPDSKQVGRYFPPFTVEPPRCSTFAERATAHGRSGKLVRARLPSASLNTHNPAIVSDLVKFCGLPICEIGSLRFTFIRRSAQVRTRLCSTPVEVAMPAIFSPHWSSSQGIFERDQAVSKTNYDSSLTDQRRPNHSQTSDLIYKRSSNEGLNVSWEDCKRIETRSSSMDDTSGIQSNDWSSDTHSDLQNTPLCLSDELATTNYKLDTSQGRCTAINEVVSILEVLDTDPEKAAVLLEEDRFCDITSSHDQLTRLALAIETDAKVPGVLETSGNVVRNLQRRVEMLQASNKDMFRDICNLRQSFQCDERKMEDISSRTSKLREDVHELRYLDDLLNLLREDLERISERDWPFVVGRVKHPSEEMNLVV
ncbi:uncharacterized protein LOC143362011 [Halictus rubicundus]|uniref:uncharacterized protein LOC143362011 n=1 Tax=Halictus rubicundus TaxID=77578 RepID=UPI004035FC30